MVSDHLRQGRQSGNNQGSGAISSAENLRNNPGAQQPVEPPKSGLQLVAGLLDEKSLFQVWKASFRPEWTDTSVVWAVGTALLLTTYVLFAKASTASLTSQIRSWSDLGFSFATSILGFVLAGFTIFATMSRPEMFQRMATTPAKNAQGALTGSSILKQTFLRLLGVFAEYWFFTLLCVAIRLLAYENGPASSILNVLSSQSFDLRRWLTGVSFVLVGTAFVYVVIVLQSFIFNMYHLVVVGLAHDIVTQSPPEGREEPSPPAAA